MTLTRARQARLPSPWQGEGSGSGQGDGIKTFTNAPEEKTAAFGKCSLCGGRRGFLLACRVAASRVTWSG